MIWQRFSDDLANIFRKNWRMSCRFVLPPEEINVSLRYLFRIYYANSVF